ncbi:MAG: CHASE2 domain-containing protein [Muribaculaceae bacterium]|nr:CHASE2 domain-containing protein [Muribaculaceae bacterium]
MKKLKNKLFYVYSFVLYLILAAVTFVLSTMFLELNARSFFLSNFTNKTGTDNNSIIVVADQAAYNHYGTWNRSLITELLDYFHTYAKVKVVGLDYTITSINPQSENDKKFLNQVAKMDNLVVGFTPSKNPLNNEDIQKLKTFEDKFALKISTDSKNKDKTFKNISKVENCYLNAAKNFASVKIKDDNSTGTVFSASNLIQINDRYYASLPLKMYLVGNNTNEISLDDKYITVDKTNLKIPHNNIRNGEVQTNIKYYYFPTYLYNDTKIKGDYTHFAISAYKIIDLYRKLKNGETLTYEETQINAIFNKNTPVFIGEFIDGPTSDVLKTPLSSRHPGVDVQATIYSNIENNEFMYIATIYGKLVSIMIIALLTIFCIFKLNFIKSLGSILLIDGLLFVICVISTYFGYLIDFITPIAIQLVTMIFGFSFKFISENRNKEKIKQAMGKYLSQDIMKNVVSNIDDLKLGGKRAIVTVLFSDIRGFTSLSEKMSAEEVSVILNEYFSEMEPIISKYNGVINKFIGDAVMAIFGEPIQDINHPQNAVKCAYEMLKKVEYLREKWIFEGKPKIEIGVGINTGEVFIGNIGTETRMEYTVIGDTVNLASRIESYNKVYKTNLLVSSSTYSHIADIADVIKISEVQIRGKAKKMNIYEVLRIDKNR